MPLASPFSHRGDRPTYHPRIISSERFGSRIEPLEWSGSADSFTVSRAHGFAQFPEGTREYREGDEIEFLLPTPPR